MDVSIIICTRQRSKALLDSLEAAATSIRFAKSLQCEIVLVDNGSTDDTPQVAKDWQESNADIACVIVQEPNKGLSRARNKGLDTATGSLICFTDDDCCLSEGYIQKAYDLSQQDTEPTLRGGDVQLGNKDDLPIGIRTSTEFVEYNKSKDSARHHNIMCLLMGCNMIFPKAIADQVGKFDVSLGAGSPLFGGEDTDYVIRSYNAGFPIQYVPGLTIVHYHGRKEPEVATDLMKKYIIANGALFLKHLFTNPKVCLPYYWDCKQLIKEIVSGKNLFKPEIGISYKHVVFLPLIGSAKYIKTKLLPH